MDDHRPRLLPPPMEGTEDHEYDNAAAFLTDSTQPPVTQKQSSPACYPQNHPPPELFPPPLNAPQPGSQAQQQQESTTVVLASNPLEPSIPDQPNKEFVSFAGPYILSCLTVWILGIVFGTIAFVVAMTGKKEASVGKIVSARRLYRISCGVSVAGIVVGFVIIIIVGSVGIQKVCFSNLYRSYSGLGCHGDYYTDVDGCQQCCSYYNSYGCSYGAYSDENGCRQCCNSCSYGYQDVTSSNGCKLCCTSTVSCSYGSYKYANGCIAGCCPGTTYSDSCYYGFQNTSYIYGCEKCCASTISCSSYSMTRDANGCLCNNYVFG